MEDDKSLKKSLKWFTGTLICFKNIIMNDVNGERERERDLIH